MRRVWTWLPGPVLLVLGVAGSLPAQVPDTLRSDTVYAIEPIAVRAIRPTTTTGGVSAVTVHLDSVRVRPAPLLEHVLREIPLVQVRTNSRGESQIALRGADERQVAILLDGVPLTLGWDHRTDLSIIPLTAARSIELIRGMSSVLYGPNVLGGVVDIQVGSGEVSGRIPTPLQLAAGVDQTGGYTASAVGGAGTRDGRIVVRAGAGRRAQDGVPAPAGVDAVYPALIADGVRANSDLRHTDGFLSARYTAGGGWLAASVSGFQAARGVPVELHEANPRLWRYPEISRFLGIASAGTGGIENRLGLAELQVNFGADFGSTTIESYALPAVPDAPGSSADLFFSTLTDTEASEDRTLTARITGGQALAGGAAIDVALILADVHHDQVITLGLDTPIRTPVTSEYRQRLWSAGAEVEIPLRVDLGPLNGGRLSAGLVYDGADTPETGGAGPGRTMSAWGGRVGISSTTGGGGLLLHAAVSRRGRFPALREMYSTALGRFHPNPELAPETLRAVEAGFTGRAGPYDAQVVAFHQRLKGAIARGPAPPGSDARFMRVNRDEIRSTGLEVLAGYTTGPLSLETELTWQDVRAFATSAGVRPEYEPELVGGIGGSIPLGAGIEAGAEIAYWSEQFCSTPVAGQDEYLKLEPGTRTDFQLARMFHLPLAFLFRTVGLELAVENLTDAAVYDQCGLPRPGRTMRLQVRLD